MLWYREGRNRQVEISWGTHLCVTWDALTEADMMIYLEEKSLMIDRELDLIKREMHTISLLQAIQNIKWIWKKYCQINV